VKALQLAPVIGRLALLIVNRREAAAILGRPWSGKGPTAESLAVALAGSGPAAAIVTDSSEPLAVASGTETRSFASLRARVRSVNGAGDALAAGTIYGLSTNLSLLEAIPYGLAAAALIVESEETTRLDLTPDLLAARLGAGQKASP
jgi:pseudouridine kinase